MLDKNLIYDLLQYQARMIDENFNETDTLSNADWEEINYYLTLKYFDTEKYMVSSLHELLDIYYIENKVDNEIVNERRIRLNKNSIVNPELTDQEEKEHIEEVNRILGILYDTNDVRYVIKTKSGNEIKYMTSVSKYIANNLERIECDGGPDFYLTVDGKLGATFYNMNKDIDVEITPISNIDDKAVLLVGGLYDDSLKLEENVNSMG